MNETSRHREPVRYELIAEADDVGSAESTLASMHRHLRGRYHVAAAASVVFAAVFAVGAWHATKPTYQSTGLVRVDPVPATTMHDPDGLPSPTLMSAYVAEQAMILHGRTVLETAVQDPMLRAAGWPTGDAGIAALEAAVQVEEPKGQNILTLRVADAQPTRARAAVDAILRSYQTQAGGPADRERRLRLASLEPRRTELIRRIDQLQGEMLDASQGTGAELIERMHITKVEELIATDAQLEDLQTRRAAIAAGELPGDLGGPVATASTDANSSLLQTLGRQQNEIMARIDAFSVRYGPRHPMMRDLEAELETIRLRIAAITGDLSGTLALDPGAAGLDAGSIDVGFGDAESTTATAATPAALFVNGGLTPIERLDALIARAQDRRVQIRTEIADLSRRRVEITGLGDRIDDARLRLSNIERRIEIIEASGQIDATGVTVATWGDLPVAPSRDRRAEMAIAGGIAGTGFGVLLILGLAALAPRVRYADDIGSIRGAPPVVAIVPDMSEGGAIAEARSTRGIHQLRSTIEQDTVQPDRNVVVITGCARGEGRTSTALALATGLARSGRRTLVVDADLTGSKLSRELILDGEPGLVEALGVNPGDARIHETAEPGLWALPVGVRGVIGEEVLSRPRLQWLLDTLRPRFDAIVVDTGPMLASAEGPTLAGVADRSVLVVERGIRASAVATALERLRQVSGRCVGVVLNRAGDGEFRDLELRSESPATRRGSIVETRPSAVAPTGRSSAIASLGGRPVRTPGARHASTSTSGRTAA